MAAISRRARSTSPVDAAFPGVGTRSISACQTRHVRQLATLFETAQHSLLFVVAPIALLAVPFLCLLLPATRPGVLWLLAENHLVEQLTFVIAFGTAVSASRLVAALRSGSAPSNVCHFYSLFALAMLILAMEEIAWGQQLLHFSTPRWFQAWNAQGETTLHNIGPLQGKSELLRLSFAISGLVGVTLSQSRKFQAISVPPVLLGWLLVIAGHAVVDAYNDVSPIGARIDYTVQRTSEVVELICALTGMLYVRLNRRRFDRAMIVEHHAKDFA